ncbi:MAG: hypothetical protein MUE54_04585 [Anaerolineae bacterium]|nr:hypothetical protein [Anaerolineae bacterium]
MDNIYQTLTISPTLKSERTIIGEAEVIIVTIPDNRDGLPEMDVYIGITDSLLTIGTRNSTLAILAGEAGLISNAPYQNTSQFILPNATHYWFTNGDIITIFFNFVLLWLVPPPQDPLSDFDYYEGIFTSIRDYQPNLVQFADLFDSASLTTSVNGDTLFIRTMITLTQK